MKILLISLLTSFTLALASTSIAETLTLDECLERASRNNQTLKTVAWDSRIAEINLKNAQSASYPKIDAQAGYTVQHKPQAVFIAGRTAETQQGEYATAGISAHYTIYDFGRRQARIQQAKFLSDSSENMFKAKQKDISLQVIEAYFGILEAAALITSAEEETSQIEQHRRIAQIMYEEGVVTRNDVLQADVRLASARQKLLAVKNRQANAWLLLNHLTGQEQNYRAALNATTKMAAEENESLLLNAAVKNRSEITALRQGLDASEAELKESKNNFMPELFTRFAVDYVQNDKAREQSIFSAFVGIRMNFFDGFSTTAGRDKALLKHSRNLDNLRQSESAIDLEIASAKNDVRVAKERIEVARTAIRQSEENLRINRERYRERVGTATDVLDAQTMATQSSTDYHGAVYDHQVSLARLKHALGLL
jgi:outer membrane protein